MNVKILIVVSIVIAITFGIVYLEQGSSRVSTVDGSTYNATQPIKQSPVLSNIVTTDKSSYEMGDAITISGAVKSPVAGTSVIILILDPNDLLLQSERIFISSDGLFQTTVTATPAIWKQSGTYTIWTQYGSSNERAQTTFNFAS
jgi:flagellar hook assembly protein FlgD